MDDNYIRRLLSRVESRLAMLSIQLREQDDSRLAGSCRHHPSHWKRNNRRSGPGRTASNIQSIDCVGLNIHYPV
jgi:hypothetical protein